MVNQKPTVSIVMATFNRAGMIDRTIESVRHQSIKEWELILADDGSKDDTPAAGKRWEARDQRVHYVRSDVNQGISRNYNMAFAVAKGKYVAMIDDDDPWIDEDKLKKQVEFLDTHPEYVACGGGVIVIDGEEKELYRYLKPETDEEIRKYMLFSNPMANSTTMFRRHVAEEVGWYDGSIRYSGDRDFFMKLGLKGRLYNFPEYFSYYTMAGQNTSIARMRPHLKTSLIVMQRYKKDYPGYLPALLLNWLQYGYSFIPDGIKKAIHYPMARLKRLIVK